MEKQSEQQNSRKSMFKLLQYINSAVQRHWNKNVRFKLGLVALGICLSYFVVGILQEKITKTEYNNKNSDNHEKFTYEYTLVAVQFTFSYIFIKALDIAKSEDKEDRTHFLYYVISAFINAVAMICSYTALRWVSFPMQLIFKSAKPLSIMIIGLLFCKRYPIRRYFFVFIIVTGVIVFKYFEYEIPKEKEETTKNSTQTSNITTKSFYSVEKKSDEIKSNNAIIGIGLLILSLTMDGILGAIQDRIRVKYGPSFQQFMLGISAYGSIIVTAYIIGTGEVISAFQFICRHRELFWEIPLFGTCNVFGQLFIYIMISSFGSLACSVTTTMRKFFSVLFSVIFFRNPSTPLQWIGASLVFGGLFADAYFGKKHNRSSKNEIEMTMKAETNERLIENSEQIPTI